jgi:hypothetical protein
MDVAVLTGVNQGNLSIFIILAIANVYFTVRTDHNNRGHRAAVPHALRREHKEWLCDYPATARCAECGRWFCDAHTEVKGTESGAIVFERTRAKDSVNGMR